MSMLAIYIWCWFLTSFCINDSRKVLLPTTEKIFLHII
jgi:hypothetical protein